MFHFEMRLQFSVNLRVLVNFKLNIFRISSISCSVHSFYDLTFSVNIKNEFNKHFLPLHAEASLCSSVVV